jgi:hypothetical protein
VSIDKLRAAAFEIGQRRGGAVTAHKPAPKPREVWDLAATGAGYELMGEPMHVGSGWIAWWAIGLHNLVVAGAIVGAQAAGWQQGVNEMQTIMAKALL